ncbi:MAG: hypothetical protein JWN76_1265 [Chitinophagaceae bacterium]|nr:hypothetical protein [Chitinophagaceae bacterium]
MRRKTLPPGKLSTVPRLPFNNSTLRAYFIADQGTMPAEIGYEMNDVIFSNLPNANALESQQILLTLPSQAQQLTLFNHLTFQWNPRGHIPEFFMTPHFDFHCYMISLSERLSIDTTNPSILYAPAGNYIPANYYGPTGAMNQMGCHWIDLLSPEFVTQNSANFTKTFVYGSKGHF